MGEVGYVYILKNKAMPGLYKIGTTGRDDLELRIGELYKTNVPFPFECVFAVKVEDYKEVEREIHYAFHTERVNENREFFTVTPDRVIPLLKRLQTEDVTTDINKEINESLTDEDRNASIRFKGKRPRFNFFDMGINKGSKLTLTKGNNPVEVVVESENKVIYNGSEYSLYPLTKDLLSIDYKILPLEYWRYEGKLLQDIYNETYPLEE